MSRDVEPRPARHLQRFHLAVLAGLAPTVLAWWWVTHLTDRVATEPPTAFDPEPVALALVGIVVLGSISAFWGLFRVFRGDSPVVYWAATLLVWAAALGLGLTISVGVG